MSRIHDMQIKEYLDAIKKEEDEFIEGLRHFALENNVPIIKNEVKELIEVLLASMRPLRILEVGTAIGYSSLIMNRYLGEKGRITTIEISKDMVEIARKNILEAGKESKITILEGDAGAVLPTLTESYDFIFMDAAKGQYINLLPTCLKLLKRNGLLVSDNVLQNGDIAKSRWSIPRRHRTIHQRMRSYLWELTHNKELKTTILPIADGVTISCRL